MSAILLILSLTPSQGPTNAQSSQDAESHFEEGLRRRQAGQRGASSFRLAAEAYDELRRQGIRNADLHRNLGNAYYLAGDLPRAILAYRMGLRLDPTDVGLKENLEAARESAGTLVQPGRGAGDRVPMASKWLFVAFVVFYLGGCLSLMRWGMVRRLRHVILGLSLLSLAAVPAAAILHRLFEGPARPIVVVAREGVLLRKGNGEQFPPWSETGLARGVEGELLHQRDGWLLVELAHGEVGWVGVGDVVVEDAATMVP